MARLLRLTLSLCVLTSCKTSDTGSTLRDDAAPGATPRDESLAGNWSFKGGLLGSNDTLPQHLAGLPTFKHSTEFPATPDFQTTPPPTPDMQILKGPDRAAAKAEAKRWLDAMQVYIYEDMNTQSPDVDRNFRIGGGGEISKKRWYHMPWLQTVGANAANQGRGREAIWGLTREGIDVVGPYNWPVRVGTTCLGQEWGLALFNEPGGYAIGKAFPNGDVLAPEQAEFPVGTVSSKMLFAAADPSAIPEIATSMQIKAWINGGGKCFTNAARELTTMYHIQNDIMMKFGPNPADWMFGVYVHNPKKILSEQNPQGYWQGMEPLGVQWGNQLSETVIVSDDLKPNGVGGRLNGPGDGTTSSCYGCHQGGRDFSFEFDIAFDRQASEKARLSAPGPN